MVQKGVGRLTIYFSGQANPKKNTNSNQFFKMCFKKIINKNNNSQYLAYGTKWSTELLNSIF